MMENAILTLAQAIETLAEAITREKRIPASITIEKHDAGFSGNRGTLAPGEKATAFGPSPNSHKVTI